MGTLKEKNIALLEKLRKERTPAVRADELLRFCLAAGKAGQLSLYEQYCIQAEALTFERQSYLLPAWYWRVGILNLIPLLNMKMMALLFREEAAAKLWEAWGMEAYRLNQEKRPHYILDRYPAFLRAEDSPELLEELLKVRNSRRRPFEKGPYHDEYFPFDDCAYEDLLLRKSCFSEEDKALSGEVEDVLVEISLLEDA